jgi:hypothetical protein
MPAADGPAPAAGGPASASARPVPVAHRPTPAGAGPVIVMIHDYPPLTGGGLAIGVSELATLLCPGRSVHVLSSRLADHAADDRHRPLPEGAGARYARSSMLQAARAVRRADVVIAHLTFSFRSPTRHRAEIRPHSARAPADRANEVSNKMTLLFPSTIASVSSNVASSRAETPNKKLAVSLPRNGSSWTATGPGHHRCAPPESRLGQTRQAPGYRKYAR